MESGSSHLSEESKRILPLGFTPQEARGWFLHEVIVPWAGKAIGGVVVGLALTLPTLTPLSSYLESTLAFHMIAEHFLFIAAGFSFAYGLGCLMLVGSILSVSIQNTRGLLLKLNSAFNKQGLVALLAAVFLIAYWQIPTIFDAATLSESTHLGMHFTFLIAGGLIYLGFRSLTRTIRQVAPVITGKALGLFGVLLLITQSCLYSIYPFSDQSEAGLAMVALMLVIDFAIVPYSLYNYFRRSR